MALLHDLTGKRFGRLFVIEQDTTKKKGTYWKCHCDCGNITTTRRDCLIKGQIKSCGCLNSERKRKHGKTNTRLYKIWQHIKDRCLNRRNKNYNDYGGRGITICDSWKDFQTFYYWATENGYKDNLTIDRINNNGNYEPSNCRWATMKMQSNNCRHRHSRWANGERFSVSDVARKAGIRPGIVFKRLYLGWSLEKALTTPVQARRKFLP